MKVLIKSSYETLVEVPFDQKGARLMWRAPGVEGYVLGSLTKLQYEQAANLFLNKCISMNIPAISVRTVRNGQYGPRSIKTETKRMF